MLTTLKKSAKKLLLLAVVTTVLSVASVVVYANSVYFVGYRDDGSTTIWLSCGSTAGNYIYTCNSDGCVDQPGYDPIADNLCAQLLVAP